MKRREVLVAIAKVIEEFYNGDYERDRDAIYEIGRILALNPPPRCKCGACRVLNERDRCFRPCNTGECATSI